MEHTAPVCLCPGSLLHSVLETQFLGGMPSSAHSDLRRNGIPGSVPLAWSVGLWPNLVQSGLFPEAGRENSLPPLGP